MAVEISCVGIRVMISFSLVDVYHRFGEYCCCQLQGKIHMDAEDDISVKERKKYEGLNVTFP
jgi:hypothetical protein